MSDQMSNCLGVSHFEGFKLFTTRFSPVAGYNRLQWMMLIPPKTCRNLICGMVIHPTVGIQAHWPNKNYENGMVDHLQEMNSSSSNCSYLFIMFFYLRKALVVQVFPQDLPGNSHQLLQILRKPYPLVDFPMKNGGSFHGCL